MAEIVNLRKVRKARDRAADEARADANRTRFGRPKAERDAAEAELRRSRAVLDAHRRDET
jgi:hypothetical protein